MTKKSTDSVLSRIQKQLENEKEAVDGRIKTLIQEDPFLQEDRNYSHELAQDATDTAGHDRVIALKAELLKYRQTILAALNKIRIGTYGKCEACKKPIDENRLAAMPMATLCLTCEARNERT